MVDCFICERGCCESRHIVSTTNEIGVVDLQTELSMENLCLIFPYYMVSPKAVSDVNGHVH